MICSGNWPSFTAFTSLVKAVNDGQFRLQDELFFNTEECFTDFEQFENQVIGATFANHKLDAELYSQVQHKFTRHLQDTGTSFTAPMRVDVLMKP